MEFSEKREMIEDLVLKITKTLDTPKMLNYKRYELLFKNMNNEEFSQ